MRRQKQSLKTHRSHAASPRAPSNLRLLRGPAAAEPVRVPDQPLRPQPEFVRKLSDLAQAIDDEVNRILSL